MFSVGKYYELGNMVCKNNYRLALQHDLSNHYIIKSNASSIDSEKDVPFEYRVFMHITQQTADPSSYVINNTEYILSRISKLNCDIYSKNHDRRKQAEESILAFCNDYGLLLSRAYFVYLENTQFLPLLQQEKTIQYQLKDDTMYLDEFIYMISKIRALSGAYTIYNKIRQFDPSVTYNSENTDLVFCLKTLLTLLLPSPKVFNITNNAVLLKRLWNIDYLQDLFNGLYYGHHLTYFDSPVIHDFTRNPNPQKIFGAMLAPKEIAEKLDSLHTAIDSVISKFQFIGDCSFDLIYPDDITTQTATKSYYDKISASLNEHAKELVELLGHTALCILNRELQKIKTFLYLDPKSSKEFYLGYQCVSLYEEIILEIASMYVKNTTFTKCERHDCDVLFKPTNHHDKKYCSIQCSNIVAKRAYNEKKRNAKLNQQQKTDNN